MTPTPETLAESLSASEVCGASLLPLGHAASNGTVAAVSSGGNSFRQGWRRTQQQVQAVSSYQDSDASRRSSAVGDLRVVGSSGGGLGLTPRSTLAPRQQQAGPGRGTAADGRPEQQPRGAEALPLLKPAPKHVATISVRAGPILARPLPPDVTAAAAVAAAAAAAVASKRRSVIESEVEQGRGHLGPEDSLSYGPAKWSSPPRQLEAGAQREPEREPAGAAGAAAPRPAWQPLHGSAQQARPAVAAGELRQRGRQAPREERQQQHLPSTAASSPGAHLACQSGRDQLRPNAASDPPLALAAEASRRQVAAKGAAVASTGAGSFPEAGPPPAASRGVSHARQQQQQGHPQQRLEQYGSPLPPRLQCAPPRSPVMPVSIQKQQEGHSPTYRAVVAAALRSPPRSPSGLGLTSSPLLR